MSQQQAAQIQSPQPTKPDTIRAEAYSPNLKELDQRFPGVANFFTLLTGTTVANIILQISHPAVGHGVVYGGVKEGSIIYNPLRRLRTIVTYVAVILAGTAEEKKIFARSVNRMHAKVRSDEDAPVAFNAMDKHLQLWVASCICYALFENQRMFSKQLSPELEEQQLQYLKVAGTSLQVPADIWHKDMNAFNEYMENGFNNFEIDDDIKKAILGFLKLKGMPKYQRAVLSPLASTLLTAYLPEQTRKQLDLEWTEKQQKRFSRLVSIAAFINQKMPRVARQFPANIAIWDLRRRIKNDLPVL